MKPPAAALVLATCLGVGRAGFLGHACRDAPRLPLGVLVLDLSAPDAHLGDAGDHEAALLVAHDLADAGHAVALASFAAAMEATGPADTPFVKHARRLLHCYVALMPRLLPRPDSRATVSGGRSRPTAPDLSVSRLHSCC